MIPATYPHDPIVEAVAELTFVPTQSWSPTMADALIEAFRGEYSGHMRRRGHIQIPVGPTGTEAASVVPVGALLPTSDGKALIGIGENLLSVHVLTPYPGWVNFRPRIGRAVETFVRVVGPAGISRVAIRYVDQIALPIEPNEAITEYFPCLPIRPNSMPRILEGFHVVTQASDPAEAFTAILRLASTPARLPDGRLPVLYDLDMVRLLDPPMPVDIRAALEHLDFLHARQRTIFEDSITERTRQLFQ